MEVENENKHVCEEPGCGKSFSKPKALRLHVRIHSEEMSYICTHEGCTSRYKRSDHLNRHIKETHIGCELLWCSGSDCDALFKNEQNLKKHKLRKHNKERYKCKVVGCGKVFRKHHQLKAHSVDHNQELPFRCKHSGCTKAFPLLSKLLRHAKTHEGYTCKQDGCDAWFDKWTLLLKHRKLAHYAEFTCPECQKVFKQKNRLKRHQVTHTDDRLMFVCPHDGCGREYTENRNLQAHIRSYHDGKRWSCEHEGCGQSFATKQKLQLHMDLHDPTKPPKKKKPRKRKSQAEHATGLSIATESRGQDNSFSLKSPKEDSIELPDLDEDSSANEGVSSLPHLFGTFNRKLDACETEACLHSSENEDDIDHTGDESKKIRLEVDNGIYHEDVHDDEPEVIIICRSTENTEEPNINTEISEKSGAGLDIVVETVDDKGAASAAANVDEDSASMKGVNEDSDDISEASTALSDGSDTTVKVVSEIVSEGNDTEETAEVPNINTEISEKSGGGLDIVVETVDDKGAASAAANVDEDSASMKGVYEDSDNKSEGLTALSDRNDTMTALSVGSDIKALSNSSDTTVKGVGEIVSEKKDAIDRIPEANKVIVYAEVHSELNPSLTDHSTLSSTHVDLDTSEKSVN